MSSWRILITLIRFIFFVLLIFRLDMIKTNAHLSVYVYVCMKRKDNIFFSIGPLSGDKGKEDADGDLL